MIPSSSSPSIPATALNNTVATPARECYSGILVALVGPCGGGSFAGLCNTTTGSCQCSPGWSGAADLMPMDLSDWDGKVYDCPVHRLSLQIVWALPLLTIFQVICGMPYAFREQCRVAARRSPSATPLSRMWFHAPLQTLLAALLAVGAYLALHIIKVVAPDANLIGIHVLPTILFAMSLFLMHVSMVLKYGHALQQAVLSKASGLEKQRLQKQHAKMSRRVAARRSLQIANIFMLLICVVVRPQWDTNDLSLFAYNRVIVQFVYTTLQACFTVVLALETRMVQKELAVMFQLVLSFPHDDEVRSQIEFVRDQLLQPEKKFTRSLVVVAVLRVAYLCAPPMWSRLTYVFPIILFLGVRRWLWTMLSYKKGLSPRDKILRTFLSKASSGVSRLRAGSVGSFSRRHSGTGVTSSGADAGTTSGVVGVGGSSHNDATNTADPTCELDNAHVQAEKYENQNDRESPVVLVPVHAQRTPEVVPLPGSPNGIVN